MISRRSARRRSAASGTRPGCVRWPDTGRDPAGPASCGSVAGGYVVAGWLDDVHGPWAAAHDEIDGLGRTAVFWVTPRELTLVADSMGWQHVGEGEGEGERREVDAVDRPVTIGSVLRRVDGQPAAVVTTDELHVNVGGKPAGSAGLGTPPDDGPPPVMWLELAGVPVIRVQYLDIEVRYLRLTADGIDDFVELREVRIDTPEPAGDALVVAAFARERFAAATRVLETFAEMERFGTRVLAGP